MEGRERRKQNKTLIIIIINYYRGVCDVRLSEICENKKGEYPKPKTKHPNSKLTLSLRQQQSEIIYIYIYINPFSIHPPKSQSFLFFLFPYEDPQKREAFPLLFSSSQQGGGGSVPVETFQSHVCQLNQSPWDVIPFDSDSLILQFEDEDDSFTAVNNGSTGDSFGAVESSVASLMDTEDTMMVVDDNHHDNRQHGNGKKKVAVARNNSRCKGFDGKGWACKNVAKQGQSFCHHHLTLLRSFNSNTAIAKKTMPPPAAGNRRGTRVRTATKKSSSSSSSNPNEFYYYSGFGPLWGKRRGDNRNGEGNRNSSSIGVVLGGGENSNSNSTVMESDNVVVVAAGDAPIPNNTQNVSQIDNGGFDFVDDDDEEEDGDDDDDNGKKRMRKPVKARSLKSLM